MYYIRVGEFNMVNTVGCSIQCLEHIKVLRYGRWTSGVRSSENLLTKKQI